MTKKSFGEVTLSDETKSMLGETPVFDVEKNERHNLFRDKFLELGEDCQKVLSMFFNKIKMEVIMEKMGYASIGYTKKRKFQCKQKLVRLIEADPVYAELKY